MSGVGEKRDALVTKPGPRLGTEVPLKFVRKGSHGKKSTYAELTLTSMVDMLMLLVVFLLQTFSASGELTMVSKNIVLPEAINFKDLERASVIGVSKESVTLDGQPVANAETLNNNTSTDWKITELNDSLLQLKQNYKLLHPGEDFKGLVIVQADRGVDFKVIKKVLYTCAVAGYNNVNFAVNTKAKSSGS